ncbi:glycerate kinase [Sporosarcina sp. GW1-11]|uniref:glycerate kinase n=1 Tax=Sporosarcina sp. GW1-11 TaxID=2899126 RepID=UPI00294D0E4D|nr:glycerate kinase [Sporosarcina sp. GW1-11]MDV6378864.1 glycerate kinase [Sporosarcina sp. GW1-11]
MKVIVAPDAFKGSLTAEEAAVAMERGVKKVFPEAEIICLPVADGGEGTLESLVSATNGRYKTFTVHDPLGRLIKARLGILGDGETAVVELAQASGITLLTDDELDLMKASTYGTGELIRYALDEGYRKLIVGLGGSATNDGGTGLLEALGVRFLDCEGKLLKMSGYSLSHIDIIDVSQLDKRLKSTDILIASDVENPLVGVSGATHIFGPQKGADAKQVEFLDAGMLHFADETERLVGKRLHDVRGAGAAGGTAGALLAYCGARLESGIAVVLRAMDFVQHLSSVDVLLTGEGKTDLQTLNGKALIGVARLAAEHGIPVIVVSGAVEEVAREQLTEWFAGVYEVDDGRPLAELMANASELLTRRTEEVFSLDFNFFL